MTPIRAGGADGEEQGPGGARGQGQDDVRQPDVGAQGYLADGGVHLEEAADEQGKA
jgi:hypothetical protein